MFGLFRNREKYNGTVDTKLNNEYQIQTRNNPRFPGLVVYLDLIDKAWQVSMNEDEAAMYIATLYFCGIVKAGYEREAAALQGRLITVAEFCVPRGMVSEERFSKFAAAIRDAAEAADLPLPPLSSSPQ
jgi:hypothetical protein